MDTDSTSSNEEFVSYRNLETQLGFKPSPTRNYMYTSFNRKTNFRELLFDGAYPLHEATNYIEEFMKIYIESSQPNTAYYMSVILDTKNIKKETDTLNLCVLEPNKVKSRRVANVKSKVKEVYKIFDNIYNSYCSEDVKYNRQYRKHTTLRMFLTSKKNYYSQKKKIKLYLKNPDDPIIDSDKPSVNSDESVVNVV